MSKNKLAKVLAPNYKAQVDTMSVNKTDKKLERITKEQLKNLGKVGGKGS